MISEIYYQVTVSKIIKGVRETKEYTRIFDSEHPKMKEANPPEQYQYRSVVKNFTDTDKILEQRVESVDVEQVLKAINGGLK